MKLVTLSILISLTARAASLPPGFNPERWPGRMPPDKAGALQPLVKQLQEAQQKRDLPAMRRLVRDLSAKMGDYAGVPETKPEYAPLKKFDVPDAAKIAQLSRRSLEAMRGRHPWETDGSGSRPQARLRVSFRSAVSYLRCFEAGASGGEEFRAMGVQGFDYIASQQASTGVFGYPYDPNAAAGLTAAALKLVREGERRGVRMTEGRWLIDDLEDGGLQFDNGEAGAGLVYAWAITRNPRYLEAARRAADWAAARRLVANWNYNSFSGWLLARFYRATGEKKYLDAAIDKFEYGVLPGQMPNGRWFDQHNASPQYHALMCRNLVEYTLALEQAKHPRAKAAREKTALALDSMAEETIEYGPSNVNEGLPLEALATGLIGLGERENWLRAASAYANFLMAGLLEERISRNEPRPETLPALLVYLSVRAGKTKACEVGLSNCRAAPTQARQAADSAADSRSALGAAMAARDESAVRNAVQQLRERLGPLAGVPEAEPKFRTPSRGATPPSRDEVTRFWSGVARALEADYNGKGQWHLPRKDAPPQSVPLRYSGDPMQAMTAALAGGAPGGDLLRTRIREAADFLLTVQRASGLFPFPDIRPHNQFFGQMVDRTLRQHPNFLQDGWIVEDTDGGLQFDNGVAGVALVEAWSALGDDRYLASAAKAADWALSRPCVPNFNYNAFSVWLLARVYGETREAKYLESAIEKTRIGVLPGLMENGRWVDPHNARAPYHWIMVRALAVLEQVLPADHSYRPALSRGLESALNNITTEVRTRGVATQDGLGVLADVCCTRAAKPEWLAALAVLANATWEMTPSIEHAYSAGRYLRYRAGGRN